MDGRSIVYLVLVDLCKEYEWVFLFCIDRNWHRTVLINNNFAGTLYRIALPIFGTLSYTELNPLKLSNDFVY